MHLSQLARWALALGIGALPVASADAAETKPRSTSIHHL
jgi:hypothetical protein